MLKSPVDKPRPTPAGSRRWTAKQRAERIGHHVHVAIAGVIQARQAQRAFSRLQPREEMR